MYKPLFSPWRHRAFLSLGFVVGLMVFPFDTSIATPTKRVELLILGMRPDVELHLMSPRVRMMRKGALSAKVQVGQYVLTAWVNKQPKIRIIDVPHKHPVARPFVVIMYPPKLQERRNKKPFPKRVYQEGIMMHTACNIYRKRLSHTQRGRLHMKRIVALYCRAAAVRYQQFLSISPQGKNAYEVTWYLADVLYVSHQYQRASIMFKKVRDWPSQKKYKAEAASSLVDSLLQQVYIACRSKRLHKACEWLEHQSDFKNARGAIPKQRTLRKRHLSPLLIPSLQQRLLQARVSYLRQLGKSERDTRLEQMYLVARIYFAYDHLRDARKWLWSIVHKHPRHRYAKRACQAVMRTYYRAGNTEKIGETVERCEARGICLRHHCGRSSSPSPFIRAQRAQKRKQYLQAARQYVAVIDKNPTHKDAPAALWNAALLLSKVRKYDSAVKLYRRIVNYYPNWNYADQALLRLAKHAEKVLAFAQAMDAYKRLGFSPVYRDSKHRAGALLEAASLAQDLQRYEQASRLFMAYAKATQNPADASNAYLSAANNAKKAGKISLVVRILEAFIGQNKHRPKRMHQVFLAYQQLVYAYQKDKKLTLSIHDLYKRIVHHYKRVSSRITKAQKASIISFLHDVQYQLATRRDNKTPAIQAGQRRASDRRQVRKHINRVYSAVYALQKIDRFGSSHWSLCAVARIVGNLQRAEIVLQRMHSLRKGGAKTQLTRAEQNTLTKIRTLRQYHTQNLLKYLKQHQKTHKGWHDCYKGAYRTILKYAPLAPLPRDFFPLLHGVSETLIRAPSSQRKASKPIPQGKAHRSHKKEAYIDTVIRSSLKQSQVYHRLRQWKRAESLLLWVLKQKGAHLDTYIRLGRVWYMQGKWRLAERAFWAALSIAPKAVEAKFYVVQAMFRSSMTKNRRRTMLGLLKEILSVSPTHVATIRQIGYLYLMGGQRHLAIKQFQQALQHAPRDRIALFHLVVALQQQKQYTQALKYIRRLVGLFPGDPIVHYAAGMLYLELAATISKGSKVQRVQHLNKAQKHLQKAQKSPTKALQKAPVDLYLLQTRLQQQ